MRITSYAFTHTPARCQVESLRRKAAAARAPEATEAHTGRAMRIVARYASLLLFAAYCADEAPRGLGVSFVAWCELRPELLWLMTELTRRPGARTLYCTVSRC